MKKISSIKICLSLLLVLGFSGCVQETHLKTITFKLDMTAVEDFNTVGIRGSISPLSWDTSLPLYDTDNDGVFETTIELKTADNALQFKFVKNDDDFELKGEDNRRLPLEYKPETLTFTAVYNQLQ